MLRRVSKLTRVEIYSTKKYEDNANLNKYVVGTRVATIPVVLKLIAYLIHTILAVLPAG